MQHPAQSFGELVWEYIPFKWYTVWVRHWAHESLAFRSAKTTYQTFKNLTTKQQWLQNNSY